MDSYTLSIWTHTNRPTLAEKCVHAHKHAITDTETYISSRATFWTRTSQTSISSSCTLKTVHCTTLFKGKVHQNIRKYLFHPIHLDCFWVSCRLRDSGCRDCCVLSNKMEVDGTRLVVLKAPKNTLEKLCPQSHLLWAVSCTVEQFFFLLNYTSQTYHCAEGSVHKWLEAGAHNGSECKHYWESSSAKLWC